MRKLLKIERVYSAYEVVWDQEHGLTYDLMFISTSLPETEKFIKDSSGDAATDPDDSEAWFWRIERNILGKNRYATKVAVSAYDWNGNVLATPHSYPEYWPSLPSMFIGHNVVDTSNTLVWTTTTTVDGNLEMKFLPVENISVTITSLDEEE